MTQIHELVKELQAQPRLTAEETHQLLDRAERGGNGSSPNGDPLAGPLVQLASIEPVGVDWLWHPYLPKGKLTLLEGDPGLGKSWAAMAIAAAVSTGYGLPGMERTDPQTVVFFTAEDDLADTLRPRLDAMGANVHNIYAYDAPVIFNEDGIHQIDAYAFQHKPALVVVDPLVAYLGGKVDMHRANETREVMTRLRELAEYHHCSMLLIRHLTKGGSSKAIYRGIGSIDFTAAARSALLVGEEPGDEKYSRVIVHIKSNLAPVGRSIGYHLHPGDGFKWTGFNDRTAEDILGPRDPGRPPAERDEAKTFLVQFLSDGPRRSSDGFAAAEEMGISEKTLKRAKADLGVDSFKDGGGWWWTLPHSRGPEPSKGTIVAPLENPA